MTTHKNHLARAYGLDSAEATQAFYSDWAATYDAEVSEAGYVTPRRCAAALAKFAPSMDIHILDMGCGTGLSGIALRAAGFTRLTGSDINPEMLEMAKRKGIYSAVHLADPTTPTIPVGCQAIAAIGVIGSGAAPLSVLHDYLNCLPVDGLMVFSFNDHTLAKPAFDAAVRRYVEEGFLDLLFEDYGPHLPGEGLQSRVYVVRRLPSHIE